MQGLPTSPEAMTDAVVNFREKKPNDSAAKSPSLEETQQAVTTGEGRAHDVSHGCAQGDEETSRLRALEAEVVDQDEIERNIGRQVRAFICNIIKPISLTFQSTGRPSTHWASK